MHAPGCGGNGGKAGGITRGGTAGVGGRPDNSPAFDDLTILGRAAYHLVPVIREPSLFSRDRTSTSSVATLARALLGAG